MLRRPVPTLFAKRSYSKSNLQPGFQFSFDCSFLLSMGTAITINSTTLYIFNFSKKEGKAINNESSYNDMPLFPFRR